ncbi:MAG TPA: DUF3857 domain-containing protein [Ferruginibacter sp.]|nr:DUF3857 domain-containing protein [Ferruginibacter sp.]
MKKRICFLLPLVFFCCYGNAQPPVYSLSAVPASLKEKASIITHEEDILFEVTDIDRATLTVHKVFTVLSKSGKDALLFNEYSNKIVKLDDAEIKVYDAAGKQVAKYKKKDMFTTAVGEGLVEDGSVTYFEVQASGFPITVEFNYVQEYRGTLFYPGYFIQSSAEAVQRSSYTAKVPAALGLRYKTKNIDLQPVITQEDKYKIYKWSVKDLAPIEYEEGAVSFSARYPGVVLAPNQFKVYDVEGDMSSWQKFGMWEHGLIQGLDALPEERKQFFQQLVKNAATEREKIKLVYEYLQKNFRYVSIQLGIGGFKPFPALFTDQKKYGDCKGLSFYTYSVLKALGIKSYVALINREYNDEPADPQFPCNEFNHMILCVPGKSDTIWLECTGKTHDFGSLDPSTYNRNALLITEQGGVLVPTPSDKAGSNIFSSKSVVEMAEDGSGRTKTMIEVSGEYKEDFINHLFAEKSDDQKIFLQRYIKFKQPDAFSVKQNNDHAKTVAEIELLFEKIQEFTAGSKMFLGMGMYKLFSFDLPTAKERRLDYYFHHPLTKTDTTVYKLPAGYVKDVLPEEKKLSCAYAGFTARSWFEEKENAVYITATLTLLTNRIPAAKYAEVKQFFDDVKKYNAGHVVVKKAG